MPNIELHKYSRPSTWRKMAVANWRHPTDPQVYARVEVDMGKALEFADKESRRGGVKITATHLVLRAVALCLRQHPDANAVIRWNRVYARKRVHVFCHVAIPGKTDLKSVVPGGTDLKSVVSGGTDWKSVLRKKPDLSGVLVRDADTKDVVAIAQEIQEKVKAVRAGTDKDLARTKRMLDRVPSWINGVFLRLLCFLQYTLNLDLRRLGIPQDPFGGAAVTSVGSFGISEAYVPLSPITRTPIIVAVGKVEEKPVVRSGSIVIRPMCVLCGTFDHRIMDGYLAGKLAKFVTRYLSDPELHESRTRAAAPADAALARLR